MIKSVIIDDEPNSRALLKNMLQHYCENVEVLGEAGDVDSGVSLIERTQPELVFLDIEMPGGNGFDILNKTKTDSFAVIFVTGYDHYAIKAIKYAALDYLVKPLELSELRLSIRRAIQKKADLKLQLQFLNNTVQQKEKSIEQIVLNDRHHHIIVDLNNIIYLEAKGNYVLFHLEDQAPRLATHPMSHYEQLLSEKRFFRIHKSHIINLRKVEQYEKGRTGIVFLSNGTKLDIAARRKSAFIQAMNELNG